MISDATIVETPARQTGSVWEYISPSRLNCWLSCPLKFKFRYVDGIKSPPTPSLFLGKTVHAGLEVFYRHRQLGITLEKQQVTARMLASWDRAIEDEGINFDEKDKEEALQTQAVSLVEAYLDQAPADERPLAVETTIEVPLSDPATGEDLGVPLLGIVDLILDEEAGPVVVDFKTAARGGELLEVTNEIQLTSYAYGFRYAAGIQEGELQIRRLIKTRQPKIETHRYQPRTDVHFRRLFAVIRAYVDDLDSGNFLFRPGLGCSFCEFRNGPCCASLD